MENIFNFYHNCNNNFVNMLHKKFPFTPHLDGKREITSKVAQLTIKLQMNQAYILFLKHENQAAVF